jgi:hypothetical protein
MRTQTTRSIVGEVRLAQHIVPFSTVRYYISTLSDRNAEENTMQRTKCC